MTARAAIRSGTVAALAAALTLTLAAAAPAAVPGLERVVRASDADPTGTKVVGAPCPAGKRALGLGGDITGAQSQVALRRLRPEAFGATAFGVADRDGTSGFWLLRGYTICADPVPGLQIVRVDGPSNSVDNKHVTARCPAGTRLVGSGGDIVGQESRVMMSNLIPSDDLTSVLARGAEDQAGTAVDWFVRAYAVCAAPLPGLQLVSAVSALDSAGSKAARAACPAGKALVGTGGRISGGLPVAGQLMLDGLTPDPQLTAVTVRFAEDQDGTAGDWRVHAFAICASA
jgi:hypothetical protein